MSRLAPGHSIQRHPRYCHRESFTEEAEALLNVGTNGYKNEENGHKSEVYIRFAGMSFFSQISFRTRDRSQTAGRSGYHYFYYPPLTPPRHRQQSRRRTRRSGPGRTSTTGGPTVDIPLVSSSLVVQVVFEQKGGTYTGARLGAALQLGDGDGEVGLVLGQVGEQRAVRIAVLPHL